MGKAPRGHDAEGMRVLDAATKTIDFLNDLNRSRLYHPADEDGDPRLPLGYSEFDIFEADGQGFRIAHGSLGGPGNSGTYGTEEGAFGAPKQRELLNSLDLVNLSRPDRATTFQIPQDFMPAPAAPFDDLRDHGIFTADEDAHLLRHKRVELAGLCEELGRLEGRRTGEAMQLIALCMMMGMGHLLLPERPMMAVLRQLLAEKKEPLDKHVLSRITLSYHQWQVPVFDTARLFDAQGRPFGSLHALATLFTFAKVPDDEEEDRALRRAIPTHFVAAVQRFTDACAGRENSHFGNAHDAISHMVEYMVQEARDDANLAKWAEERYTHAKAGLGNSNTALIAARAIVDAFLAKKYPDATDDVKAAFIELFFQANYWRTPANRLRILQRYPRHGPVRWPGKQANIETEDDGVDLKA